MAQKKTAEISATKFLKSNFQDGSIASFPALPIVQNRHRFYISTIPVAEIFPFCVVARRQEDPIQGFQRNLSEERARDIARYLDDSKGSIPTNIVLSAQPQAELLYNNKSKTLKYKRVNEAFLVLDGQHRLYGYGLTTKPHRVPVAIYEGLSRIDEASLFIDINTNQRGVPAALLLDIKQVAERESVKEIILRRLFDSLNTETKSPLNGLLSPSESTRNKISRSTFNKAADAIIDDQVLQELSEEKQMELVRNYFRAMEGSLSNPKLLSRSAYFEAFCEIFPEVLKLTRAKFNNYKEQSMSEILAPLRNIDLDTIAIHGATRITKNSVAKVLHRVIGASLTVTEDMI